jgi:hypothetical protein
MASDIPSDIFWCHETMRALAVGRGFMQGGNSGLRYGRKSTACHPQRDTAALVLHSSPQSWVQTSFWLHLALLGFNAPEDDNPWFMVHEALKDFKR